MEMILLIIMISIAIAFTCVIIRELGKYGEDCWGYPYNCPCCPRAAKCIIEIGRDKDDA